MTHSGIIGILRETRHIWERRAPLTPAHVADLLETANIKTIVQPCTRRAFPLQAYIQAGATAREDLSEADVILGIKEVRPDDMVPNKRHIFFSHTHKGQSYNMPLLHSILNKKKITLIDHELLTDQNTGSRLVKFGTFAGYAGFVDGLHSLGRRLLAHGQSTPFLNIAMSHSYPTLNHARKALVEAGEYIAKNGLPSALSPFTVVFTGNGSVSTGAQAMLKCLPHEFVDPSNLAALCKNPKLARKDLIYASIVTQKDYLVPKGGYPDKSLSSNIKSGFCKNTFLESPESYESVFHKKIAPYTSFLVTGHFWHPRAPRMLSCKHASTYYNQWRETNRMISIADISCDIHGAIEFMSQATKIDDPYFFYDPVAKKEHRNLEEEGIQIMSVDILPSEFPIESSKEFGDKLVPILKEAAPKNWNTETLKSATIASAGKLMPKHEWLYEHMEATLSKNAPSQSKSSAQRVLIFGSGFVSGPTLEYLLRFPEIEITVATQNENEVRNSWVLRQNPSLSSRVKSRTFDVASSTEQELDALLKESNLAISLVPATLHTQIAKACIRTHRPLVTASYISPDMASLHRSALENNVLLLNEMGLDPGIDHMSAMQFIDTVKASGGVIKGFRSWCGGLPAPECSDNPLGYKFSWNPRGALLASLNPARYLDNGIEVSVSGEQLLASARPLSIIPGIATVELPNRDSLAYVERYKLDRKELRALKRGTLRFPGYCEHVEAFRKLGLLDASPSASPRSADIQSWPAFLWGELEKNKPGASSSPAATRVQLREALAKRGVQAPVIDGMEWLKMFDSGTHVPKALRGVSGPRSPSSHEVFSTPAVDILCELLGKKLVYAAGERDMVLMHHEFEYRTDQGREIRHTSTFVAYGDPTPTGSSAMAKTVGLPAAAAAKLILDGKVGVCGVVDPTHREIYEPVLSILTKEGIVFKNDETAIN